MVKPKYQIGDVVFTGSWKAREHWEKCPDCGGTRTLKVTLFDGTEYIIDCASCAHGYDPLRGTVRTFRYDAEVVELMVQGVSQGCFNDDRGKWEYQLGYELGAHCHR
jgi:hypothetical protein